LSPNLINASARRFGFGSPLVDLKAERFNETEEELAAMPALEKSGAAA
jgi:hypothetical protein